MTNLSTYYHSTSLYPPTPHPSIWRLVFARPAGHQLIVGAQRVGVPNVYRALRVIEPRHTRQVAAALEHHLVVELGGVGLGHGRVERAATLLWATALLAAHLWPK